MVGFAALGLVTYVITNQQQAKSAKAEEVEVEGAKAESVEEDDDYVPSFWTDAVEKDEQAKQEK